MDEFTLTEAGWLWCSLEPPDSGLTQMPQLGKGIKPHPVIPGLPARGDRVARALWLDIKNSKLVILSDPTDDYYRIPRVCLRTWAEQRNHRPPFLFPELRAQARNSLNLDDALQIIDVLASMQKRHGLIANIERAIQQAGGNLNRNSISKYLKVIKK